MPKRRWAWLHSVKTLTEGPGRGDAAEVGGEVVEILHRIELGFGERVVA